MTADLRAQVEAVLADREAEVLEAERRHPDDGGCIFCGVGRSEPRFDWKGATTYPPWTFTDRGAVCSTCAYERDGLTDDEYRVRCVAVLLGIPNAERYVPAFVDDVVRTTETAFLFFSETDAEPQTERFGYLNIAELRVVYDTVNAADEPAYETDQPCKRCGVADQWLRVPAHSTQTPITNSITDELLRVAVTDHPEHLECANCQRLQLLSVDVANERMNDRSRAAERQGLHRPV